MEDTARIALSLLVSTMVVDVLEKPGSRPSAAMLLMYLSRNIRVSTGEGLMCDWEFMTVYRLIVSIVTPSLYYRRPYKRYQRSCQI